MSLGRRNSIGGAPDILAYNLKATRGEAARIVRRFLIFSVSILMSEQRGGCLCSKSVIMWHIIRRVSVR